MERAHLNKEPMHDGVGTVSVADPPELLPREGGVLDAEGVGHGAITVYAYSIRGAPNSVNVDIADVTQAAPRALWAIWRCTQLGRCPACVRRSVARLRGDRGPWRGVGKVPSRDQNGPARAVGTPPHLRASSSWFYPGA